MSRYYVVLSRCVGTCALEEFLNLASSSCKLRIREIMADNVVEVEGESEEVLRCSSKAVCAREVVEEVSRVRFPAEGEEAWRALVGELAGRVAGVSNPERRLLIRLEIFDPWRSAGSIQKQLIAEQVFLGLRSRGIRAVPVRGLADVHIWIGVFREHVSAGVVLQRFRGDRFLSRDPQRRSYRRPFALPSTISRMLFNLAKGRPSSGPLLDAFCGTGSVLIESALEGVYSVGVDVLYENIRGARRNAVQYGVYHLIDLVIGDAEHLPFRERSFGSAVFDPPYGRAAPSKGERPDHLLRAALMQVVNLLKPGSSAAFLSPASEEYLSLSQFAESVCSIYVHSGLTRLVWVARTHDG